MTTIKLKINTCKECPYWEEGYPESTDGFDSGNDWFCKMVNDKKTGKKKYCHKDATDNEFLFNVYNTAGTYWQHWNYETNRGCKENLENINPSGKRCLR